MNTVKLGYLLKGIGSTPYDDKDITEVVTDSRLAGPGKVFVAIVGERLDGNDFAQTALDNGAEAAVVSRPMDGDRFVIVDNTLDALAAMANNYRTQFNPIVVGITGSVGKTTTKEMTAAVLSAFGKTLKNEGNRNNEIGLPETIFRLDGSEKFAITEMGMAGLGEIRRLTKCAVPDAAIITCIGIAHLEALGSRENILKAKLEITEGMTENGLLVLNGDDDMLMSAKDGLKQRVVLFGINNKDCDVTAENVSCRGFSSDFIICDKEYGRFNCNIPCTGIHSVMDALAAYTLTTRLGLEPSICAASLSDYTPSGMRQRFVKAGGTMVIEDCYNANPDSMKASLKSLSDLPCNGIRIAVLGDMLELGSITEDAHKRVGIQAAKMGVDVLLCYGEAMKLAAQAAESAGVSNVQHFDDKKELGHYLVETAAEGDLILVKGSRGMALEDVLEVYYEAKGKDNE